MKADPALEAYLSEAASWDADRAALRERSARTAWRIAALATALLTLAILALVALLPLKHVEPFLVRVDSTTGVVDVVPVYAGHEPIPQTVTRYLIDHYVTVCERFNFATAESDYEECGAFHTAARNQAWFAQWERSNPASPLNLYKDGTSVRAQVGAVSFFERGNGLQDLAQVRYTKATRAGAGGEDTITHWIATVQYGYGEPSKDPKVRRWNPLGFKIAEFHSESELVPTQAPAAPPGTGAGVTGSHSP